MEQIGEGENWANSKKNKMATEHDAYKTQFLNLCRYEIKEGLASKG